LRGIFNNLMDTPILFLIYNRPEYTKKVFNSIRDAKPNRLFIHADGPKKDKPEDVKLCERSREIVSNVDWDCEVKTLFRDKNLGCKLAESGGFNWFFENVDEGIIIEDDCLPNKSFFLYCEKLLKKYRDNEKVMMISGSNPATSVDIDADYFFSIFYHSWGWATWKRAWEKYDITISDWPRLRGTNFLKSKFPHSEVNRAFVEQMFDQAYKGKASTWDIQWTYACLVNDGYAILPKHNMISNIGYIGTHEMNNDQLMLETKEIDFKKFKHLKKLEVNYSLEKHLFEKSGLEGLINKK